MEPRRKEGGPGFHRLQAEVDRVFLELLRGERVTRGSRNAFRPNADVYFDTRQNALVIKLELAGVDPNQVDLEVEENVLRISGARLDERHPEAIYQQMEIAYGRFERLVLLPPEVDVNRASANYSGGFLEIVLPMQPRSASKRIPITIKDECDSAEQAGSKPDNSSAEGRWSE
ncbi:MAG: Hsp20/alpha crystallin family protein [Thermoleophilia bacterium]|nr:Hsp20/alpha crystallin family protein [Thermoleophilia bacterium]